MKMLHALTRDDPPLGWAGGSQQLSDLETTLNRLASTAWRKIPSPSGESFWLKPSDFDRCVTETDLTAALEKMCQHARRWAPGLEVPYFIPCLRLSCRLDAAGQFPVDNQGWVAIDVSSEFAASHETLLLILAHEACHHILAQSGLNERQDHRLNERKTDLAMYICGFGELGKAGRAANRLTEHGYASVHLGYLTPEEYHLAHEWVSSARSKVDMEGMPGGRDETMSTGNFHLRDAAQDLEQRFKNKFPDRHVRERLLKYYQEKYPIESKEEHIRRALEQR